MLRFFVKLNSKIVKRVAVASFGQCWEALSSRKCSTKTANQSSSKDVYFLS